MERGGGGSCKQITRCHSPGKLFALQVGIDVKTSAMFLAAVSEEIRLDGEMWELVLMVC